MEDRSSYVLPKRTRFLLFFFEAEDEKERVLCSGPWSFASNLLVLKQCEPEIPEHCYEFSKNALWIQIVRAPPGWFLEEVLEVQLMPTGKGPYKIGKVTVEVDLRAPLKNGTIVDLGDSKLWVEFKYEIGHYALYCEEIPYEQTKWADNKVGKYGPWLKAEVRARREETILETQNQLAEMELVLQTKHTTKATPIRNKKRTESPFLQDAIGDSETRQKLREDRGKQLLIMDTPYSTGT
ncbi:hypothetical protein BT93_J0982 [Corymbia citriodora subsp. variegata]|nr:hypothetical protein BT93_J0982 [Corymbia citriodora subsp. variegata]